MNSRMTCLASALAIAAAWPAGGARADVPPLVNNQGVLRTAGGVPIEDGTYDIQFTLYASEHDWVPLWTEVAPAVTVTRGFYSTVMGTWVPIPGSLFREHAELWLGMRVQGYPELPRQRLHTVGYAFEAGHAVVATAAESLDCDGCVAHGALGFDLCVATAGCERSLDDMSCAQDAILRRGANGWECGADRDTTYQAGPGLFLQGTTFEVVPGQVAEWARAACYDTPEELKVALAGTYAAAGHDHDASYAPLAHEHAGVYAPAAHEHAGVYSPSGHDHTGVYSPATHDHAGVYSPATHDHDARYYTKAETDGLVAGAVTAVEAGPGLSGGGTEGTVQLSLAPPTETTLGGVKAGKCAAGSKVAGVGTDGALICGEDLRPSVYMTESNARTSLTCDGQWHDYLTLPVNVARDGSSVVFHFSFSQPYEWDGPNSVWRAGLNSTYSNPKFYRYASGNWNVLPGGFSFMIPNVAAGAYTARIQYKFHSGCWRMSDSYTSEAYNSLIVQVF